MLHHPTTVEYMLKARHEDLFREIKAVPISNKQKNTHQHPFWVDKVMLKIAQQLIHLGQGIKERFSTIAEPDCCPR